MLQANLSENISSSVLLSSMIAICAIPSDSFKAASKDSANLCFISDLTLNLSTTISIVCFLFNSSFGGSFRSQISPLILALMNPCVR